MSVVITDVYDKKRGCGYRFSGGTYLMADGPMSECGMLPAKLSECPACGRGIKLTRGLQRVNVQKLFEDARCENERESCRMCLINRTGMGYLIGVGVKFYKTRDAYLREAIEQGISKRIAQIPRDLVVGKSVVLVGHPKVFSELVPEVAQDLEIEEDAEQPRLPMIEGHSLTTGRQIAKDVPGVICVFVPTRIDYCVTDLETPDELERLAERGLTLVRTHRLEEKQGQLGV